MRSSAQKQNPTQEAKSSSSASPNRALSGQYHEAKAIFQSQRTIGNQAVQRLDHVNAENFEVDSGTSAKTHFAHDFSRIPVYAKTPAKIQSKLRVNTPGDIYEKEADRIANHVMRMPEPELQSASVCGGSYPKSQNRSEQSDQKKYPLQTKRVRHSEDTVSVAPPFVNGVLRQPGRPLDMTTRTFMESRFGHDFAHVRVHTNRDASDSASQISARAYTAGDNIAFGNGEYAPTNSAGRKLIAHELAHVVQQTETHPSLQRKDEEGKEVEPAKMSISGDAERKSPAGGVAVRNGTLDWELKFTGKDNKITMDESSGDILMEFGSDVSFKANFTPTSGVSTCPTITFIQTVKPTTASLWDTGPLLYTRSSTTDSSVDVGFDASKPNTEPFYGAAPNTTGTGLRAERTRTIAGSHTGASTKASMDDAPFIRTVPTGTKVTRSFETAATCVETAETFGSISWGYTKTGAGVVTLLGGTEKNVETKGASADFETTRQAFYSGFFQLSLSEFGTGSYTLTSTHKTVLDAIDTKDLTRVILVGANDNSGGVEAKPELSLKRAKAAREYLIKSKSVSSSLISAEGHGVEARVSNPAGKDVPANRRVDVHLQRGAETSKPAKTSPASVAESKRLRKQNPRLTVDEAVNAIVELDTASGTVPSDEWIQLTTMLNALDVWRGIDSTVPDVRTIYRGALNRIKSRTPIAVSAKRLPMPPTGPISPEVDKALREYEKAKRRVEELKREKEEALRELDEEKRRVLEE